MAIQFTISKRGTLPGETDDIRQLYPKLYSRETVDAVEFQRKAPWGTVLSHDALGYALGELQNILLHELAEGKVVTLPGIGTFSLSLKGDIEVRNGNYHGHDVRVDTLLFRPDRKLCDRLRAMPVNQVPFGSAITVDADEVEELFTALFREHSTVTHKQVFNAFGGAVTKHRIISLLNRLVAEGRIRREGERSQTCYRAVPGNFGC